MGKRKKFLKEEDVLSHKIASLCVYKIDKTGRLSPPSVPSSGNTIAITNSYAPKGKDVVYVTTDWKLSGSLYILSQLLVESYGTQYTFQIRQTDTAGVGELILIGTANLESFPGSRARTSKSSGK